MKEKNILLINYTLAPGGAERYISELANNLFSNGYSINILLLKKNKIFYKILSGIRIFEPNFNYPNTKSGKVLYYFKLFFFLRKTVSYLKPALVINTAFPSIILIFFTLNSVPIVLPIRCNPLNVRLVEGFNIPILLRKVIYRRASVLIAQTSYAENILRSQFRKSRIIKIPNFLRKIDIPDNDRKNYIISAGRLNRGKGFDYLIKAFAQTNSKDWKLVILGEGNEKSTLLELIRELKLNSKIKILGYQKNIQEYFSKSKIFAFASLSEGFPNVLLEAMSTPLAVISFDINAGPSELIQDGENGYLVEKGNITEYASKLNKLINDEILRQRFMINAMKVRDDYSWESIRKYYFDLIETYEIN